MSTKILSHSNNLLLAQTLSTLINKNSKLTPASLARQLGIPTNKITRILNGDVTDPKASTLVQIANYFEITIEQLLGFEPIVNQLENGAQANSCLLPIFEINNPDTQKNPKGWYRWIQNNEGINYFALATDTDLYEPTFPKNALLIINPHAVPEDRSFIIVQKKVHPFHCLIKKYVIDAGQVYFYPINPKLPVEMYDKTLYTIAGVILEVHQRLSSKK